jgi:hypothetical protein
MDYTAINSGKLVGRATRVLNWRVVSTSLLLSWGHRAHVCALNCGSIPCSVPSGELLATAEVVGSQDSSELRTLCVKVQLMSMRNVSLTPYLIL